MAFYLLRDQGLIDLAVTTFAPDNPPDDITSWATGKRYPLLKINKVCILSELEKDLIKLIKLIKLIQNFEKPLFNRPDLATLLDQGRRNNEGGWVMVIV